GTATATNTATISSSTCTLRLVTRLRRRFGSLMSTTLAERQARATADRRITGCAAIIRRWTATIRLTAAGSTCVNRGTPPQRYSATSLRRRNPRPRARPHQVHQLAHRAEVVQPAHRADQLVDMGGGQHALRIGAQLAFDLRPGQ